MSEDLNQIDDLKNLPKEELVVRLMEAESALDAIRNGEVDAFIVPGPTTANIYTLKDADRPYRLLIENMNEAAITLVDDTILYSNHCFARMLKYPLEKIIGSSIYDYLPLQEREKFEELLKAKQDNAVRSEFNLVTGNSVGVQVQIAVNPIIFDGFSGYCLIITDVTALIVAENLKNEIIERKKQEKILSDNQKQLEKIFFELEQSNKDLQQFASIIASSDDAIISKDLNGIVASWNRGAEKIFGYKAEEMIGRPINILIPKDRQNEEPEILRRIVKGESIDHYDTIRQRKDGSLVDISLTISPIKDAHGIIIGASKIGRDISSRKKEEENLKKFASMLEERVTERTHLLEDQTGRLRQLAVEITEVEQKERRRLAEVLHDHLQQYLVAAKMRIELIERKNNTDTSGLQDARSYIDRAVDASRQLTAELRPPVLYEGGLSAGLRYLRQKMEDQHKIRVHLLVAEHTEPGTDSIKAMIYQCVQELLFNAVKYAKATECFVTVTRVENKIQVTVEDKGIGFNVSSIGTSDKGGFGLFSIRERIKALGGDFKISSIPGQGSMFTLIVPDKVEVPVVEENFDISKEKFIRKRSQKDGIVVLVVDDHPIIRHSLASLLWSQSFVKEVIEARNGEEALIKAEKNDPDIILMDINMPVMNGIEATQYLCSRNSRAKIIGLSVQSENEMAQAMKDVGAIAYFNKGDDTHHLIKTIKNFASK